MPPKIGDIEDGYMFLGGDPANPNSWRQQQAAGPKTIQEQHPDISWKDRLLLKNLATSPQTMMAYLKKEHPQLEIEYNDSGDIRVKRPEETDYRVLDPDTGISGGVGELIKDIGDVGYDVASGIVQGAATAGAGIAGAVGGGVGAIPAAMGAGAASGAGLEGIRQGLGSLAGLEDNADLGQIGMAGAIGAASPALFGTGASLANMQGKGLAGKVASKLYAPSVFGEAEKKLAEVALKSQRGIPTRIFEAGVNKVAPKLGGFLSATPEQTVRDLSEHLDDVAKFEKDPKALEMFVDKEVRNNMDIVNKASSEQYKALERHIAKSVGDGTLDVTDAARPMYEEIKQLQKAYAELPSGDAGEALKDAVKAYEDVWGPLKLVAQESGQPTLKPIKIKPTQLKRITTSIQDIANYGDRFQFGTVKPKTSDAIERMGDAAYQGLKNSVEDAAEGSNELKKRLAKILEDKAEIYKDFGPKKVVTNAEKYGSSKTAAKAWAKRAKEFDKLYGTNFDKLRGKVAATSAFNKDTPLIPAKRIPAAVVGGLLGVGVGRATSGQSDSGGWAPGLTGGAALGALLGGPRAVRALIEASKKTGGSGLSPTMVQKINPSVWNMIRTSKGQQ